MWNDIVYGKGGLALHAGLKVDPDRRRREGLHDHRPVGHGEDHDHVHDAERLSTSPGRLRRADAGGHASTAPRTVASRRRSRSTPTSSRRSTARSMKPTTYLENVYQDDAGNVNFFEETYTQNGRAVFEMSDLLRLPRRARGRHRRLPADPEPEREHHPGGRQALRRSRPPRTSCSARRRARARAAPQKPANFLRVPGTNPFFPLPHGLQGNRILELLASHPIETFLLNTGRVGGKDDDDRSKKLKIPHTSACVKGIAEGTHHVHGGRGLRLPGRRERFRVSTTSSCCSRAASTSVRRRRDEYAQIVDRLKVRAGRPGSRSSPSSPTTSSRPSASPSSD